VDYVTFVSRVANLADLPEQHKSGSGYTTYVRDLLDYLQGFYTRTQPLMDLDDITGAKVRGRKGREGRQLRGLWEGAETMMPSWRLGSAYLCPLDLTCLWCVLCWAGGGGVCQAVGGRHCARVDQERARRRTHGQR
jgi:hypothetical protein